jgi:hypothetical protein
MTAWLSSETVLLDATCPLPLDQPFTPSQVQGYGVSRRTFRALIAQGLVRRVTRGVYAVAQAPNTIEFRAQALRLVVSPSAVITDRTAAWLHGVDLLPRSAKSIEPAISIFQKPGTRARRGGVESGERKLRKSDIVAVHGVSVTTKLRTACDLGRLLWRFDALAALDQFLALGVPHDELLIEVARFKGYRGVLQLRALAPIADPRSESVAESALRLHWYDAGLPKPEPQWWVFDGFGVGLFRLDLALPEALFACEYDGVEFHSSEEDRAADLDRRAWLDSQRSWYIEVFTKNDVYALGADPTPRLREGLATARRRLAVPTSYPTLIHQAQQRVRPPEQM